MIIFDIQKKKLKDLNLKKFLSDSEMYKKIWKEKYNVEIPKKQENVSEKILNFVKGGMIKS